MMRYGGTYVSGAPHGRSIPLRLCRIQNLNPEERKKCNSMDNG